MHANTIKKIGFSFPQTYYVGWQLYQGLFGEKKQFLPEIGRLWNLPGNMIVAEKSGTFTRPRFLGGLKLDIVLIKQRLLELLTPHVLIHDGSTRYNDNVYKSQV